LARARRHRTGGKHREVADALEFFVIINAKSHLQNPSFTRIQSRISRPRD
jgi:hypothetical protein